MAGLLVIVAESYLLYSVYSEPATMPPPSPPGRPSERVEGMGTEERGGNAVERAEDRAGDRAGNGTTEAGYLAEVGAIQSGAVEALDDSDDKLLRYDALSAADVEEMGENLASVERLRGRAQDLDPPEGFAEHHELFVSAVGTVHEAAEISYGLASEPVDATWARFEEYHRRVDEADALLRRSNEMLDRDYETIGGARRDAP